MEDRSLTEWLYNPKAKPAKDLSKHDQEMIKLGWDACHTLSKVGQDDLLTPEENPYIKIIEEEEFDSGSIDGARRAFLKACAVAYKEGREDQLAKVQKARQEYYYNTNNPEDGNYEHRLDRPDREKIAKLLCDKNNPMMSDSIDHSFWEEKASDAYKVGYYFTADQILALIPEEARG